MEISEKEAGRVLAAYARVMEGGGPPNRGRPDPPVPLAAADWGLIDRLWSAFPGLKDPASPLAVYHGLVYSTSA